MAQCVFERHLDLLPGQLHQAKLRHVNHVRSNRIGLHRTSEFIQNTQGILLLFEIDKINHNDT